MTTLTLEHFLKAMDDYEAASYHVLACLKNIREAFNENRIYPHFSSLIDLLKDLQVILGEAEEVDARSGRERINRLKRSLRIPEGEERGLDHKKLVPVQRLIEEFLPHIQQVTREGYVIAEFVDETIKIDEVGIVPSYLDEGYLFILDAREGVLNIFSYVRQRVVWHKERFVKLHTTGLSSLRVNPTYPSLFNLKEGLRMKYPELPVPATFHLSTDLDFPFHPTVYPVAKRKMLRYFTERQKEGL